jgi:hypothetical protein
LYERMSGKGESASEAHPVDWLSRPSEAFRRNGRRAVAELCGGARVCESHQPKPIAPERFDQEGGGRLPAVLSADIVAPH